MTLITTTTNTPSTLKPLAIDLATTLASVALLVLLGKLIAALGQTLSLKDACWQLLSLRAAAGALCVTALCALGRDRMWAFGIAYGLALLTSHTNYWTFGGAVVAGLIVAVLRANLLRGSAGAVLSALVFLTVLATAGLVRKMVTSPSLDIVTGFAGDLALRLFVGTIMALAVVLILSAITSNRSPADTSAQPRA